MLIGFTCVFVEEHLHVFRCCANVIEILESQRKSMHFCLLTNGVSVFQQD